MNAGGGSCEHKYEHDVLWNGDIVTQISLAETSFVGQKSLIFSGVNKGKINVQLITIASLPKIHFVQKGAMQTPFDGKLMR